MTFSDQCIENNCTDRAIVATALNKERTNDSENDELDIQALSSKRFMKLMKKHDVEITCFYPKAKFNRKLNRYQGKILSVLKKINAVDHDKFLQEKPKYSFEELKRRVPEEYHSEIDVFRRSRADELASHRNEDHRINLMPDTKSSFIRNYKPMSEKELRTVKHYLDEHLAKRYIRPSSFKAAAPVLLVKKPEERLRFCVDYRVLNEIIIKNRYPIPLINETLVKLSRAKIFIKVNVIHAFNKMRIKEEHE
jgi:hypothetical protein